MIDCSKTENYLKEKARMTERGTSICQMENLLFCPNCKKECSYSVKQEEETYPVKGEDITILADISYCANCGEQIWNEQMDEQNLLKAYDFYRKNHNLLSSTEIRATREK